MGLRVIAGRRRRGASSRATTTVLSRNGDAPRSAGPLPLGRWAFAEESARRAELIHAAGSEVFDGPLIAAIVPVLGRPGRVAPLLESFEAATSKEAARIYFVAQRSDTAEVEEIVRLGHQPILVDDADRAWCRKINRGYEHTTEPWLLLGADDLAFKSGWVDAIRRVLLSHVGVIGTNDLGNPATANGTHSTHPLVRRIYAKICGTVDERNKVVHEGYDHNFPDTELVHTAKRRVLYLHRSDCIVEHLHPVWGKGQEDSTYQLGARNFHEDERLFLSRGRRFGW